MKVRTMSLLLWAALAALIGVTCSSGATARAQELLADPGFEDPGPLAFNTVPWRLTFFYPATTPPQSVNATIMPASGVEHAEITHDQAFVNFGPQIDTTVFAGFGGASSISDFRGLKLISSVSYKVPANNVVVGNDTGTTIRMNLAFFGSSGFLGFGDFTNSNVFESGTTADYKLHSFMETVPNFSEPVTVVGFNLSVLGLDGTGAGKATVYFDNASLTVVPEPATAGLLAMGVMSLYVRRRR